MNFPLKDNTEWTLPPHKPQEWKESYPTKDVDTELVRARQWLRDNPQRMKTGRGMTKYLGGWIARSPDVRKASPAVDRERQWEKQCGEWLRQATLFTIQANNGFMDRLRGVPGFRAWAEKENELVKEIE